MDRANYALSNVAVMFVPNSGFKDFPWNVLPEPTDRVVDRPGFEPLEERFEGSGSLTKALPVSSFRVQVQQEGA